jgi:hypothetical protein
MWIKRLVTLSSEWNTSELRHVMIALAIGPVVSPNTPPHSPIVSRYEQMNSTVELGNSHSQTRSRMLTK